MQKPKVALVSINTGAYDTYFKVLFPYFYTNFLPDCELTFVVFTDSSELEELYRYNPIVKIIKTPYEAWPGATLKRFHYFSQASSHLEQFDYIFFANANYYCKNKILASELLLPEGEKGLIFVEHFGQNHLPERLRSYERNPASLAYIPEEQATTYVAGAFYGGTAQEFLTMAKTLAQRVDQDLANGIIAIWHDESHLNCYALQIGYQAKVLPPRYLVPQEYYFASSYIGERQDWPCVLLNKNALPIAAQDVRDSKAKLDARLVERLLIKERELEQLWLDKREVYLEQAKSNPGFIVFNWQV
ncbi:hypothetical protein CKF54_04445 [Psittacicella hinzii]|uniref:Glycosyltransferase family 6 n=1 Tax=Psittacicella hinzii TaxID=2028575 RepID=A0A3A1Y620_9GAMM|nr:hypothetical protein [Psittacicella hinzii]RIY32709.1 hypothetical protein CKF54_04445 [Psittacicella hinzii]